MALADKANQYVNDAQPWVIAKDPDQAHRLHNVCTQGINMFRALVYYLAPVVPDLARRSGDFLNDSIDQLEKVQTPLLDHQISPYVHLMTRIQPKDVDAMIDQSMEKEETLDTSRDNIISIEDFAKIDLRTALIVEASNVEESNKLIRLKVDLGTETRQVFAGIKGFYSPEELVGRKVVVVRNLKPRKMKFGTSEGMILAAGDDDGLWLINPGEQVGLGVPVN